MRYENPPPTGAPCASRVAGGCGKTPVASNTGGS